jgi:hypothetical protein
MAITNFPDGISSFGIPIVSSHGGTKGDYWFVDGDLATQGNGKSWDNAFNTFAAAVAALSDDDVIFVAPGNYNEGTTHVITESNVKIIGSSTGYELSAGSTLASYVDGDDEGDEDILRLEGSNIEVTNLTFLGGNGYWCIDCSISGNPSGNWVHGCYFYSGAQNGCYGVQMGNREESGYGNAVSMTVEDNHFFKCNKGVIMDGSRQILRRNTFWAYGAGSVQVENPQSGTQRGHQDIVDNKFIVQGTASTERGIYLSGASSPTIGTVMIDDNKFVNFGSATYACNKLSGYGGWNMLGDQYLTDANPPVATSIT